MLGKGIGLPELLIILAIVVLVFGVGRVSGLGKELGTAISEFRKGLKSDDDPTRDPNDLNNKPS